MKRLNGILNNLWAKLLTLVLAFATWFYVFDLVNSDSFMQKKETVEEVFSRYEFVTKKVSVKPVFMGKSPAGYKVVFSNVKVTPQEMTIFGPQEIVDTVDDIKTDKIDLSEYTKSVKLTLGMSSGTKFFKDEEKTVDVYVPVELVVVDEE